MDAITICAVNYLPFAHILGNSFLDFNPDSRFSILVIDAKKINFEKIKRFEYFSPDDLNLSPTQFQNMSFYYNVTELSTALKPSAIKMLFNRGSNQVIYLDPDIEVFGSFDEIKLALSRNDIILTPHTLNPVPRDGLRPNESDLLGSGVFNLGFIGLKKSETAETFLNWWEERLEFDAISDPEQMLFTDQRWIDLVPSYFSFHVFRNPSYNVAYWNLHERHLTESDKKILVDGNELKFFHFSGYRPERPWILSKYVSDNPRVTISSNPTLGKICRSYGEKAFRNGWNADSHLKYGYQSFDSGKAIPSSLRRLYREDCISARKAGEALKPPLDWQAWATERSINSGNLSRILFSIWKSRPDLRRRYPDATGAESSDLQKWAYSHGISEKVIDNEFIEIGGLKNDKYPNEISDEFGISIAGYLKGELGLGQSARLIYKSAIESGFKVSTLNSNRSHSRQLENIDLTNSEKIYPFIIAVINADHFKFWIQDLGLKDKNIGKARIIGVWAWETEDFPQKMHSAFQYVDEIWAVSSFVRDAIAKHTNKVVKVFPTPIIKPTNIEQLNRASVGIPKYAKFNLFIFDYMSIFNRKNPLGVIEAHIKAFPDQNGPTLVLKSINSQKDVENHELVKFKIGGRSDIILIDNYLSRDQLTALINECDAYISLHRSEGYGLTIVEAMALGKAVIATGYSGNLDFMNARNSVLVPFEKKLIGSDSFPYSPDSYWAEPDIDFAAEKLFELHNNIDLRIHLGQSAQEFVLKNFSIENASKFIKNRANYHNSFLGHLRLSIRNLIEAVIKVATRMKKIYKILRFG